MTFQEQDTQDRAWIAAGLRPEYVRRAAHYHRCSTASGQWCADAGCTPEETAEGLRLADAEREAELIDSRVLGSPEYGRAPRAGCQHSACTEPATHGCECCGHEFCLDHGSRGGDRDGVAYPAVCWACGGYNAH